LLDHSNLSISHSASPIFRRDMSLWSVLIVDFGQVCDQEKYGGGESMSDPTDISDAPDVALPGTAGTVARERPELWRAFQALGEATGKAGPLSEREQRLVNLALAIGADSEGATHSHTRRALAEHLGPDELEHVAFLAITTLGWPQAIRGLTWVRDVTRSKRKA
jgi:alkylhydroperoxidase/carboxymuconolactone decarboxylase family protein YurZ